MIIFANPSTGRPVKKRKATPATPARKGRKKGAGTMAKHRSAAQKAATARLLAWNRKHRGAKRHRNPSNPPRKAARRRSAAVHSYRRHRNPSSGGGFLKGGVLGELLSKEGLLMVGGAFVAPMAADFIQEKIMPSATGWTKILVKAGIIGAGAWAIDKFLKQRKAAVAFGVTGGAVLAADALRLYRGQMAGLSEGEADYLATRPELMQAYVGAPGMGGDWQTGLADPYRVGLAGDVWAPAFG